MRILVVEDEPVLRQGLADLLTGAGHTVSAAGDGIAAEDHVPNAELVVLDLMLPRRDGLEVCRLIRAAFPHLPILMLTARGSEEEKVRGFEAGADDYLTKPFGARELLARVDALARRAKAIPAEAEVVESDDCRFDLGRAEARRGERTLSLTAREVAILRFLHRHRARAVSRAELLEQVWDMRADTETRTVDVTIANLRQKIERDPARPVIVVSVKGIGYAWGTP